MKSKLVRLSAKQSVKPSLALLSSIIAMSAGSASAATYQWTGATNSDWGNAANWSAAGIAQTGGTFGHRLNINSTAGNEAVYTAAFGNTTYNISNNRGLVIGSGTGNGTLRITGGKFSTVGASASDAIGNNTNAATLILDGGDYETARTLEFGVAGNSGCISTLTVNSGTATIPDIALANANGYFNLNGGTLAVNRFVQGGWGNTYLNFNGGTLKARISTTAFYPTPGSGNAFAVVKAGGAVIDTNGFDITIARPLIEETTGGNLIKLGNGTLTLASPSTLTGNVTITGGGLGVATGATSLQPASLTHSGTALNFNFGIYNPSDLTPINVTELTLNNANIAVNISGSNIPVSGEIKILDYGTKSGAGSLQLNLASLPVNMAATLEENTVDGYYYLNVTSPSASTFNWAGSSSSGSGLWDTTSASWNASQSVYAEPALVTFLPFALAANVEVASDVAPLSLSIDNTTSGTYTFSGTGKITGATGITKTGTGIAVFNGAAHTYSGPLTISAGAIIKKQADATTGNITVAADNVTFVLDGGVTDGAGQTLILSGRGATGSNYFFSGSAVQRGALQAHNGASTWQGDIVLALNASDPNRVGVQNGASLTLSGNISENIAGAGLIFRAGNLGDNITLTGPATYSYTGPTQIFSNGASIILEANNKLPITSRTFLHTGGSTIFDLNGFNQEVGGLDGSAVGAAAARILNNNSSTPSTLTVTTATGVTGYFQGSLANGAGVLSLVKSGNGTQALASENTYTGNTTITGGILEIGGGVTSGSVNPASAITNNATLSFNRNDTLTQGTHFANAITGTGNLRKLGAGNLDLTSANTYAGTTTVASGTLSLSGAGTVGAGQVSLSSGTTLNVTAATPGTVSLPGGLAGRGTVNATDKTLSVGGAFAPVALSVTGNLSLTSNTTTSLVAGASLATTSQTTVTGGTLLNAGALLISPDAAVTFADGQNYTFFTASGGITSGFTSVSVGALALNAGSPGVWSGTDSGLTYTYTEPTATLAVATAVNPLSALQTWREQFFGSPDNTGNGADLIDFDNDGLVNLMEYALGTDPTIASPNQVTIGRDGNFLTLTYPRRSPADPAVAYTVQGSSDLTSGFTAGTGSTAGGSPSVYTDNVDVSAPGTRRFLRLSVTYTPAP